MAKFTIGKGIQAYIDELSMLNDMSDQIIGFCTYEGAKVVADDMRKEIDNIPDYKILGYKRHRGLNKVQKQGLIDSFGITRHSKDGSFYYVKLGFDGYNNFPTSMFPKGQPNPLVARYINSGSEFSEKYPFVDISVNRCRRKAEKAMSNEYDRQVKIKHSKLI